MRGISSGGGKYRYYADKLCRQRLPKEEWHQPNVEAGLVEAHAQALLTSVRLPAAWRERVLAYLIYEDGTGEMEQEKFLVRERKQRARELYAEGDYTREQYERVRAACDRDLALLAPASTPAGQEALTILDDLTLLWEALTDEEQNRLYRLALSGIYVRGKSVERVEPRGAFRGLLGEAAAERDAAATEEPGCRTSAVRTTDEERG
jgi:hypothetical protein